MSFWLPRRSCCLEGQTRLLPCIRGNSTLISRLQLPSSCSAAQALESKSKHVLDIEATVEDVLPSVVVLNRYRKPKPKEEELLDYLPDT
jgi:hypothetical protein